MNFRRLSAILTTVALCTLTAGTARAETDLHWAARLGDSTVAAALLAAGHDANATENDGTTALHMAAVRGDVTLVQMLLKAGANPSQRDALGRTPLHHAALGGNGALVELLVAAGAEVNVADLQGDTPLHLAARLVRSDGVRALLAAGADVGARNANGQTALHVLGADRRDADEARALIDELAEVLIAGGADPGVQDQDGRRAWPRDEQPPSTGRPPSGYPSYDTIVSTLQNRATTYPDLCQIFDLGASAGSAGRHIWALKITDNVAVEEDEPEFKWIANIHGDEVTGLVMCLNMIDYLLQNYGTLPRITDLVNEVEIWIVPTMNPDGYMNNTRYNVNGIDLNRNFPEGSGPNPDPNTTTGRAAEVGVIMNWSFAHSFTLAANFHGGALVANYPFDNDNMGSVPSPTPYEDLFVWISEQYSQYNLPMWNSTTFYHGITNGAAWYAIDGGMQDWDYRYMGGNEVTLEIGTTKSPAYSQMPTYWSQNRDSMLAYMETCLTGVRGIVTDAYSGAPLAATVSIVGRNHNIYTDPDVGDYHRMARPGSYQLRVEAAGYDPVIYPVTVVEGPATRLDIALAGPPHLVAPNGGETLTAGVPTTVTWTGAPTAQFQVQYSANYGATGQTTDGFESGALDSAYTTGGNAPWFVTTGTVHAGTYAARAGTITHSQSTWLTRTAEPGTMSFWYKVSSESGYDYFNFYIDGVQKLHRSGNVNWVQYTTSLAAGSTHILKWEYVKDSGVSGGSDTVWIDDLSLTGDATTWTDIIALTEVGATAASWTPPAEGTDYKARVRAVLGGGSYSAWDESDGKFTVVAGPEYPLGDMNCDQSVTFADINPFVLALTNPETYAAQYPTCPILNGDINQDGALGFSDINPFVMLLATAK